MPACTELCLGPSSTYKYSHGCFGGKAAHVLPSISFFSFCEILLACLWLNTAHRLSAQDRAQAEQGPSKPVRKRRAVGSAAHHVVFHPLPEQDRGPRPCQRLVVPRTSTCWPGCSPGSPPRLSPAQAGAAPRSPRHPSSPRAGHPGCPSPALLGFPGRKPPEPPLVSSPSLGLVERDGGDSPAQAGWELCPCRGVEGTAPALLPVALHQHPLLKETPKTLGIPTAFPGCSPAQ